MKINDIDFTGYPVTDLKRARRFYDEVLNIKPSYVFGDDTTAWVKYDIGAGTLSTSNGALEWKPNAGGGCAGLEEDDFDAALETLDDNQVAHHPPMDTSVCRRVILADSGRKLHHPAQAQKRLTPEAQNPASPKLKFTDNLSRIT